MLNCFCGVLVFLKWKQKILSSYNQEIKSKFFIYDIMKFRLELYLIITDCNAQLNKMEIIHNLICVFILFLCVSQFKYVLWLNKVSLANSSNIKPQTDWLSSKWIYQYNCCRYVETPIMFLNAVEISQSVWVLSDKIHGYIRVENGE